MPFRDWWPGGILLLEVVIECIGFRWSLKLVTFVFIFNLDKWGGKVCLRFLRWQFIFIQTTCKWQCWQVMFLKHMFHVFLFWLLRHRLSHLAKHLIFSLRAFNTNDKRMVKFLPKTGLIHFPMHPIKFFLLLFGLQKYMLRWEWDVIMLNLLIRVIQQSRWLNDHLKELALFFANINLSFFRLKLWNILLALLVYFPGWDCDGCWSDFNIFRLFNFALLSIRLFSWAYFWFTARFTVVFFVITFQPGHLSFVNAINLCNSLWYSISYPSFLPCQNYNRIFTLYFWFILNFSRLFND